MRNPTDEREESGIWMSTHSQPAYADRTTNGSHGKPTLGRRPDDLTVELPEDRRQQVKERASALIAEETVRLAGELED